MDIDDNAWHGPLNEAQANHIRRRIRESHYEARQSEDELTLALDEAPGTCKRHLRLALAHVSRIARTLEGSPP